MTFISTAIKTNVKTNVKTRWLVPSFFALVSNGCYVVLALLVIVSLAAPVLAVGTMPNPSGVNSYRENLLRLRSRQSINFEQSSDDFPGNFSGNLSEPLIELTVPADDSTPINNQLDRQTDSQPDRPEIDRSASNHSFFAAFLNNTSHLNAQSPYDIIEAARRPAEAPQLVWASPNFMEQLSVHFSQLRSDFNLSFKASPVRLIAALRQVKPALKQQADSVDARLRQIPNQVKNTLSNALDRVGTKAQQTAAYLRQL